MTITTRSCDESVRESLRLLRYPPVVASAGDHHQVMVVGAGQSGTAIAFALRRIGISRVNVIDAGTNRAASAWRTRARMRTLRTDKTLTGPELGIPALTFEAWYDGTRGAGAFRAIDRIARLDWADYLDWYQQHVEIRVRRGIRLIDIGPNSHSGLRVTLTDEARSWDETTDKLILATGVSGTGGPYTPPLVAALPRRRHAHTADDVDFRSLAGRRVAVLGAGPSAFDAAATALESDAAAVHLYSRRAQLNIADLDSGDVPDGPAAEDVFHRLPDDDRWRRCWSAANTGTSIPRDSVSRATDHDNFFVHLAAPWTEAQDHPDGVLVRAADGPSTFDYVVAATGYQHSVQTRPELATVARYAARWRDVYTPVRGLESDRLGSAPYLGPAYQLTEREPHTASAIDLGVNFHTPVPRNVIQL
ncbi:MAG: NAD(P)-binding domain-containing protein [Gordonia sp. (in: high G+C Gram-positive bacteria)]